MSWIDHGHPVIAYPEVLVTAELIKRLYAMPGCDMGGPLHAMLDDGNIDDGQIHGDYYERHEGQRIERYLQKSHLVMRQGWQYTDELECPEQVADLCRLILASFRRMPETWRAAAIAWADGSAWEAVGQLAGEPLTGGPPWATPEEVEALVAELRAAEDAPAVPEKACVAIPCPSFTDVFPSKSALQGVERVRYEQTIHAPGIRMTRLDEHGLPIGEPVEVSDWAAVGIKTERPDPGGPELRWVESTIRFEGVDPGLWQVLYGWEWPKIDMDQVRGEPPQVEIPRSWGDTIAQALPLAHSIPPELTPVYVPVPEGSTVDAVGKAISMCRQLGLLKDTPGGHIIVPHGIELDSGGFFIVPPGTDTP